MKDNRTECEKWDAGEPSTRSQEIRDFIQRQRDKETTSHEHTNTVR